MVVAARRIAVALRSIGLVAAVMWSASAGQLARADTPADPATLEAKKAALFAQMLQNPSNLDVTFAYADIAAQLGDNEGAVAALERMLLFNPNLPRVDLELGVLYYRMGSFETAQDYFEKAKSFNPPPEVLDRVNEYLGKIHTAEQINQFTGYFFFGAQYQTDANIAPGSPLIASPIGDVLLSSQFVKSHDIDIFGSGSVLYSYDLGTQNRDAFEVLGTGFGDHYFRFSRLDLDLGEVTAGPRFRFPDTGIPDVQSASVKPYAIVNEVGLGEAQYFWTYGAGLESTAILFNDLAARAAYEIRVKNFTDAPDRPLSRGLNGDDNLVSLDLTKPIMPGQTLSGQFDYLDQDTRLGFYANKTYAVSLGYRFRYESPIEVLHFPWETVFFGSRSWAFYAQPDPCCSTSGNPAIFSPSDRHDRHWRYGLTQIFDVTDNVSLVLQLQRDILSSNLSIYGYTSDSVLIGTQIRF
jgi:tetratricopeptide (TPR) repeat protein